MQYGVFEGGLLGGGLTDLRGCFPGIIPPRQFWLQECFDRETSPTSNLSLSLTGGGRRT